MPTYEYECPKCGHRFEKFQSMNDPAVKTCPRCKGRKVKRLIGTGVGILFKGSGFYSTDYRSESYTKGAKADAPSGAKESGTESAKASGAEGATGEKAAPAKEKSDKSDKTDKADRTEKPAKKTKSEKSAKRA